MKELLARLAKARQFENLCVLARKDALAEFEASEYYQTLMVQAAEAQKDVILFTEQLKEEAISKFGVDLDKKPEHGGYEIKMSTKVTMNFEEPVIREWCFANYRPALKLDMKLVEKAAKDGTLPVDFSSVQEEPKVYIKSDLSKFIE